MPRPKVKPQDRLRSVKACVPCNRSKIRCDSRQPCAPCTRRKREEDCIYQKSLARGRLSSGLESRVDSGPSHTTSDTAIDVSPTDGSATSVNDNPDPPMPDDESPQSRMLLTSSLHKVYIGETGSLSYLQFLRQVLKSRVGPCAFTENEFNNYMLETDIVSDGTESLESIEVPEREVLVQCYKDATSGVLSLFEEVDIVRAVACPFSSSNLIPAAAVHLILAIGAQCRGMGPSDLTYCTSLFTKARTMAFANMLCDPGTDMVAVFLLMAFYMLGACHRNAAFMYLGVASKAASALGLQRADQYRDLAPAECRARLNVWKSLRVLDTIVSLILGRSSGLASSPHEERRLHQLNVTVGPGNSPRGLALEAAFDICPFMDELERQGSNQSAASAEKFLQRLQTWSKALPEDLRRWTDVNSLMVRSDSRELYIGGTHVACLYYFTVMLTTRRFLTMHLLSKVRQQGKAPDLSSPTTKFNERHGSSSLAHVCLNAAINLARIGDNAMTSDRMMNNMCLVKAWMFAAGLLLGFHLFAHAQGNDPEAEEAFARTRAVEQKLAHLSLQAGHYHEILTSFADVIALCQRRGTEERRRVASRFMDDIFTLEGEQPSHAETTTSSFTSSQPAEHTSTEMASLAGQAMTTTWGDGSQDHDIPIDPGMELGPVELPFTMDDLSFDWQPFAPFFDDLT